ncbi:Erythronate-4-phosphate dehydrogenase family protein [Parasponia andersonii]|uniref:Erythronate-4-phosphate dehydrogenase family protein n=1 Tax=Parasponia andersonii TaxID=3476 RepID=A0A2P5CA18_PARAD|nr:Erythronate-4-phosphate dehydrogenase family protein [Parasponia andersonii]
MESSYETSNGYRPTDNGHVPGNHSPHKPSIKVSLPWLDLKVFYVRVSRCEIDDSTPEYLTLNHVPLDPDTLLEVNGVRTSIYSDGETTVLRRDRLDKKSEEVTFVSTDSIRITGSVKFEVFHKDVLLIFGVLELCNSNGLIGETNHRGQRWSMECESNIIAGTGFLKGRQLMGADSASPTIEVYIAGSFLGTPLILTKTLQLSSKKKHTRRALLDSIPEYDAKEDQKEAPSRLALQVSEYPHQKPESEDNNMYSGASYIEGEDGELSWFNAGVRVGVGIGLSVCLGIGIGVGLLVRTYQGTTRNFRRRLL